MPALRRPVAGSLHSATPIEMYGAASPSWCVGSGTASSVASSPRRTRSCTGPSGEIPDRAEQHGRETVLLLQTVQDGGDLPGGVDRPFHGLQATRLREAS